jgi:protein O-GlcNAc transferase
MTTHDMDTVSAVQRAQELLESRRFTEAASLLEGALRLAPEDPTVLHLLGVVKDLQGYSSEAVRLIRQSLTHDSSRAVVHNDLGLACQSLGQWQDSVQAFRDAIRLAPDFIEAMYNLARSLASQEKNDEALQWAKRVARSMPHVSEAHHLVGSILDVMNRSQEAIPFLEQALTIKPNSVPTMLELAGMYLNEKQYAMAHQVIAHGAQYTGDAVSLWKSWAETARNRNQFYVAMQAYLEASKYAPDDADVWYRLGLVYLGVAELAKAIHAFEQAFTRQPDRADIKSFAISVQHFLPEITPQTISDVTREWMRKAFPSQPYSDYRPNLDPNKKLRVGFISSDMRAHPVGFFLMPLVVSSDPSKIEWLGYHNDANDDFMTQALQKQMTKWCSIHAHTDAQVAAMIAQDQVDILIDLNGHTVQNRLSVMALKPAPVQMTWLGYFNTTGVDAIDYIISDSTVIREGEDSPYCEKPLRLPDAYLCFAPPGFALEPNALPALKNGYVTFGSTNYMSKLNDDVLRVWAEILHGVTDSRLLIRNPSLSDHQLQGVLRKKFATYGIEPDRIGFLGKAEKEEFIQTYHEIDILLDPFPYNGGTTTAEALWMGVPVVTLSGDRFVSRVSHTMLKQLDMEDWVVHNKADYIAKAIQKACDKQALVVLRSTLRKTLMESPLCHASRFADHFTAALRNAWISYCKDGK